MRTIIPIIVAAVLVAGTLAARAANKSTASDAQPVPASSEYTQWCGRADRNRVASATGLAHSFDAVSGAESDAKQLRNVKWVARLGVLAYGSPVVAGGQVYMGGSATGHGTKALGAVWCFRESDGGLLWRLRSPFIKGIANISWGITSTPTVEADRVYLLGHNGEVLCLDAKGLADGNAGPFQEEAAWLATDREVVKNEIDANDQRVVEYSAGTPVALEDNDADIVWRFDMVKNARCWPINAGNAAILVRGDYLYVATCSADCNYSSFKDVKEPLNKWKAANPGKKYPSPNLIVLDKKTGALLAVDETGAFGRSFHGAHSSPSFGMVNGRELLVWGSGDGICYGIDPKFIPGVNGQPGVLKTIWEFDVKKGLLDPKTGKPGHRQEIVNTPVIDQDRVYVSLANDLITSGPKAPIGRLVCIDATKTGNITETGCVWKFDDLRSSGCTVAIAEGLLYTGDASGMVYCLDAATGQVQWSHEGTDVWASPLVADGKLFVPTHGKGLLVLATGKTKKILFDSSARLKMAASPAVANGVLYFADQKHLYAVKASSTKPTEEPD